MQDGLSITLHLMFINKKSNVTLCDWFSVLCIILCMHDAVLFLIVLSNLIICIWLNIILNIMHFFQR